MPFLDHLLTELNSRFSAMAKAAVRGLNLLPPKTKSIDVIQLSQDLIGAYQVDLTDPDTFVPELRLWKTKWSSHSADVSLPNTIEKTLENIWDQTSLFPNIAQVLKLLLILPSQQHLSITLLLVSSNSPKFNES